LAKGFAKQAIKKHSQPAITSREEKQRSPDFQTVDLNSLKQQEVRSIGAEHLLLKTLEQLELDQIVAQLGFTDREVEIAIGSIVARALFPGSEKRTLEKLRAHSGLEDLLDLNFASVSLNRMYQISDRLYSIKEGLEKGLYQKECRLFELEETLILYDLTNTYFEGSGTENPSAQNGRSKEKRSDCPLITLGLVLDGDGFCKRSRIFDGNVSEGKTLAEMVKELTSPDELIRPIVVLDAGIATDANLEWLRKEENRLDYIVVSRKKKSVFPDQEPVILKNKANKEVRVVLQENSETDEMELYCHSEDKEKKEQQIKNHFQIRFEGELKKLHEGFDKRGCLKKWDKVNEKLGRLKQQYRRVAHLYQIDLQKSSDGEKAQSLEWKIKAKKEEATFNGTYCLRTSIKHFTEDKIWKTYTMLTNVEAAFRCMKSELGLRPIFHQTEKRTAAHLFITVLAYHLVHTIRYQLQKETIHISWARLREAMSTQVRATIQIKRKDGKMISIRKASEPELFHKQIYGALKMEYYPGKIEKTIM